MNGNTMSLVTFNADSESLLVHGKNPASAEEASSSTAEEQYETKLQQFVLSLRHSSWQTTRPNRVLPSSGAVQRFQQIVRSETDLIQQS
ncbi:uncharacterized protein Z520_07836 [Fonsecaea multimorphosa CBS 102226]|uniref:Uncharacterized protein n=1 Tax=Fonsecaea multimorphosa CBS 102226 TaxID=1442371 RepID=A0A0D2H401_9EURO|nr:uncharacterized protein Z520_07836 [Fonsecaea multimorphosa CBS 102226]KIX96570.1 hypothetical protein Z520_07836 [Fonsecaea multimorphosa CBS 102226]